VINTGNKRIIYTLKSLHLHKEGILNSILFQINDLQNRIQIKETEISHLLQKERELQEKFQAVTDDSKFADFLRKTYKKKYKLPKAQNLGGE
jgi:predicted  nucleic acid-binding Zn-ribbon protein